MRILKFYTNTCGPCRLLSPILDKVAEETGVELEAIDASIDPRAEEFRISAVPTIVLMKNEEELDRKVGLSPYASWIEWIKQHGAN